MFYKKSAKIQKYFISKTKKRYKQFVVGSWQLRDEAK